MKKTVVALFLTAGIIFTIPVHAKAQSDYEFYFFGINLKSFQDSNWLKVIAGAVASVLVHELGHALYLQSQGKDWDLQSSSSSGLAIHTSNSLSDNQYRNFGRAGFTLQTFVGAVLTTFQNTKYSDFTRGWVGMNAFQVCSYNERNRDLGDDFKLIERGGGNKNFELGAFYLISSYNLLKMDMPAQMPFFSTATKAITWPKSFLTRQKQSDQYMLSSSDKPAWLGKEHLIFNQNIDKVIYGNDFEIIASNGNNSRLLSSVRNNTNAEIINF
ncbi:MAG: hypothetical protein GY797_27485 [Deltaproteobacteria bacterium]|nr:hypothetical protein [Deltaproteobacteria bacterium]